MGFLLYSAALSRIPWLKVTGSTTTHSVNLTPTYTFALCAAVCVGYLKIQTETLFKIMLITVLLTIILIRMILMMTNAVISVTTAQITQTRCRKILTRPRKIIAAMPVSLRGTMIMPMAPMLPLLKLISEGAHYKDLVPVKTLVLAISHVMSMWMVRMHLYSSQV
jgi:hypothetical protein